MDMVNLLDSTNKDNYKSHRWYIDKCNNNYMLLKPVEPQIEDIFYYYFMLNNTDF